MKGADFVVATGIGMVLAKVMFKGYIFNNKAYSFLDISVMRR